MFYHCAAEPMEEEEEKKKKKEKEGTSNYRYASTHCGALPLHM